MVNDSFRALVLRNDGGRTVASAEELDLAALPAEDTLVKIEYSTLNFKDALAITGRGKIVRSWPFVPGIDFAGTVVESANSQYQPGTKVILTGWGVGEKYWGGLSQYQRVKSEWLVPLPDGLTTRQAMMVGTAGFTAMLCVGALERAGMKAGVGPVLVTGASGGVGSIAVAILNTLGYQVSALTRDPAKYDYVATLGASESAGGPQWSETPRPLEGQRWVAAIDTVGSNVLARVLAEMRYGGVVAACGLAGGADLTTTVMPFILRNVTLVGVDSVMVPAVERMETWKRIARDLPLQFLEGIASTVVPLDGVQDAAERMLEGKLTGRVLVDLRAA
ncbi:MDR family oxidoreductase [Cupriavidus sp. 2SB]|uniref:MDR family oxidoreductase n=1 Tax=Cupriavidus sp. 2SB TaxID=2502199 RepID=UPI0010F5BEBF|nr:MDR family oxidoreductase [Cupriavidus sp. 2SB]